MGEDRMRDLVGHGALADLLELALEVHRQNLVAAAVVIVERRRAARCAARQLDSQWARLWPRRHLLTEPLNGNLRSRLLGELGDDPGNAVGRGVDDEVG